MTPRTNNLTTKTGCIEDRTFIGVESGELNQVPGADIFFSYSRDIIAATDEKVSPSDTLRVSVLNDVDRLGSSYTVHNDVDHGEEYDGCGFVGRIDEISQDLIDNFDAVFGGSKLSDEKLERASKLVSGLGRICNEQYFSVKGGQLVEEAHKAGATLVTYVENHTAGKATVDGKANRSYDSLDANDPSTDSEPSYNVDPNHAKEKAEEFGIDQDDAEILARLLATSTVRVLSEMQITELIEV